MGKVPQDIVREIAASGIRRAVETGTYLGDGAIVLAQSFDRVDTFELSRRLWLRARLRLLSYPSVHLHCGDSSELLRPSGEPTLYWLDGHWSADITAGEERQCPLLDEITATSPGTQGDIYLIDDARLFLKPPPPPMNPRHWPTIAQIVNCVNSVRPGYEVIVNEPRDLIVIKPVGT